MTYHPTLILGPATVINVWTTECRAHFSMTLTFKLFHCSRRETSNLFLKLHVLDATELQDFLNRLDYKNEATAQIMVISSYATWQQCTEDKEYRQHQEKLANEDEEVDLQFPH